MVGTLTSPRPGPLGLNRALVAADTACRIDASNCNSFRRMQRTFLPNSISAVAKSPRRKASMARSRRHASTSTTVSSSVCAGAEVSAAAGVTCARATGAQTPMTGPQINKTANNLLRPMCSPARLSAVAVSHEIRLRRLANRQQPVRFPSPSGRASQQLAAVRFEQRTQAGGWPARELWHAVADHGNRRTTEPAPRVRRVRRVRIGDNHFDRLASHGTRGSRDLARANELGAGDVIGLVFMARAGEHGGGSGGTVFAR